MTQLLPLYSLQPPPWVLYIGLEHPSSDVRGEYSCTLYTLLLYSIQIPYPITHLPVLNNTSCTHYKPCNHAIIHSCLKKILHTNNGSKIHNLTYIRRESDDINSVRSEPLIKSWVGLVAAMYNYNPPPYVFMIAYYTIIALHTGQFITPCIHYILHLIPHFFQYNYFILQS